jgi:hypothetical protein
MYHLRAKIHARSSGKSAVACAAYRAGERLIDERFGKTQDYSRKQGVVESGIEAPTGAAAWVKDRGRLWNAVEQAEGRKNSRLSREFEVSLPHELSAAARKELVQGFIRDELVKRGMVADWAIHEPNRRGDQRAYHVHIMTTTRAIGPEGFGAKVRAWDKRDTLVAVREAWAIHANRALERAGIEARIDHRTLEAQGIRRMPVITKGVKLTEMERSKKWKSVAKEILDRMKAENMPKRTPELAWDIYRHNTKAEAIGYVLDAVDDPTKIPEAKAHLLALREKIIEKEASVWTEAHEKALATATKKQREANQKLVRFERANPEPDFSKRLLESDQHHGARLEQARAEWRRSRWAYSDAAKRADEEVQRLTYQDNPRNRGGAAYDTRPEYQDLHAFARLLSDLPRELSQERSKERGRDRDDRGLGR